MLCSIWRLVLEARLNPDTWWLEEPKTVPGQLHILHVVIALEPGGLENGIVNVANRLDPGRFRLSICCLEQAGAFAKRLSPNVQVIVLNKPLGISPRTTLRLHTVLGRLKPDLVHTHGLGPLLYTVVAKGFRLIPPILHGEHRELLPDEQSTFKLLLRRILYRRCARIHTVSASLRLHLQLLGFPQDHLLAIPNGVDINRFKPADKIEVRRSLKLPETATIVGMVTNLRPEKGHLRLIQAFDLIATEFPSLHLLLVGDGPAADQVTAAARASQAANRIHCVGHQPEPVPWYQAMDLLILPSSTEGLSNATLEAMACGVPVLASKACGNEEVIRHLQTGYVFALDTPPAIAEAMRTVLGSSANLAVLGQSSREHVGANFNLETMAQQYANTYAQLSLPSLSQPG